MKILLEILHDLVKSGIVLIRVICFIFLTTPVGLAILLAMLAIYFRIV